MAYRINGVIIPDTWIMPELLIIGDLDHGLPHLDHPDYDLEEVDQ